MPTPSMFTTSKRAGRRKGASKFRKRYGCGQSPEPESLSTSFDHLNPSRGGPLQHRPLHQLRQFDRASSSSLSAGRPAASLLGRSADLKIPELPAQGDGTRRGKGRGEDASSSASKSITTSEA